MNIVFFTQEDPFYVKIFFDQFLKKFHPLSEIKAIVISRSMGKKSLLQLARQMYDLYGPTDFVRMGLKYLYFKIMGKRSSKRPHAGMLPKTYTINQLAEAYDLNVLERSDLNSESFLELVQQFNADLFISVASPIIFKEKLISIPQIGCINIHNAPLPFYRGMLPNFWQLYHGEKQAGITIHRIFVGIDTGDIIKQVFVPIEPNDSLHDMIVKTKRIGADLMIEVIDDFRSGKISYSPLAGEGSYYTFPTRKDAKEFKKRGKRLL